MPKLLGGAQRPAVQASPPGLPRAKAHLRFKAVGPVDPPEANATRRCVEAYELRIRARPWREALSSDMKRFEEVRLARPVRARDQHDPGLEGELELGIRAEVPERDLADDQPATGLMPISQGDGSA